MCVGLRLFERTTASYTLSHIYKMNGKLLGGNNSVVGIATRYGVDGPGIESPEGARLPVSPRSSLMPTQPSVQWVPCLFRG